MTSVPTAVYDYRHDEDTLVCPAGLLDRVLWNLDKAGIAHSLTRSVSPNDMVRKLDLANAGLSELRPEQKKMLLAILENQHTLCKSPTGSGKTYMISKICRLYPNARVVVTTDSVDVIATIQKYLESALGESVGQMGGGKKREERVTVCTLQSLKKLLRSPDILIVDEAHVVGADNYAEAVLAVGSKAFKTIGLTATPHGRSDGADLIIEGVCGPLRFEGSYQDSVANKSVVQIEVDVYDCPYGPDQKETSKLSQTVDKERLAIWSNAGRNKLIADIVREEMVMRPEEQILVYVDKIEHALYLKRELPSEFVMVTGEPGDEDRLDVLRGLGLVTDQTVFTDRKARKAYQTKFENKEIKYVICNKVWQKGVSFNHLSLLVRADASSSEITTVQASGRVSRMNDGKSHGRVIDFRDSFNASWAHKYKSRLEDYTANGWKITHKQYVRTAKTPTK